MGAVSIVNVHERAAADEVPHERGVGLDHGVPVSFIAVSVNNGNPALDTFSLVLSDGYANSGHLLDGIIQVP